MLFAASCCSAPSLLPTEGLWYASSAVRSTYNLFMLPEADPGVLTRGPAGMQRSRHPSITTFPLQELTCRAPPNFHALQRRANSRFAHAVQQDGAQTGRTRSPVAAAGGRRPRRG